MKKVILFEDLDKINFYFSLLLIPFFKKIYFRDASYAKNQSFFLKKKNKIFFQIGLKNQSGKLIKKSYAVKKYLLKNLIRNNFKKEFFDEFCKLIGLNIKNKKKLIYTIENKIYISKLEAVEVSSYICIKKKFYNCITYYIPSNQNSYLIVKQIKNNNLKVISLLLFINIFILDFKKLFKLILKKKIIFFYKNKIKNKKKINEKNCTIGYCPHDGLKYGNFFNKTFFYQKIKNSPLHKDKIETISFNNFDKVSARFLKFFKLKNVELANISFDFDIKKIFKFFLFFIKNQNSILNYRLVFFKIFFEIYMSINKYNNFFKKKKYNYLFFDNDTLIPSGFLISADINRIRTLSMQDRLTSYMYFNRCFFDLYLLAGSKFQNIFKNKYFIETYDVQGLTRSELIKKNKFITINKLYDNKSNIVACLPLKANSNWLINLYGESGSSINTTLIFCKNIVKLSKKYTQKKFIIKFKVLDPIGDKITIKKINKIISHSDNVFLDLRERFSCANLIACSEIVIGIYSTILDEAMAIGKDVIIYDDTKFISSFGFFTKNKFALVNNYSELFFKFKSIINKKSIFYKNYAKHKKKYILDYLTENGNVGYQKNIVKKVEKYINNQF